MLRHIRAVKTFERYFRKEIITAPPWCSPEELRDKWRTPNFPKAALQHFTEYDNHEKREKYRQLLSTDQFMPGMYL